jgi:hypothetical protein
LFCRESSGVSRCATSPAPAPKKGLENEPRFARFSRINLSLRHRANALN